MPNPQVIIQIDASDLQRVARDIGMAAAMMPQRLEAALDAAAVGRLSALQEVTPVGKRSDERYAKRLSKSYEIRRGVDSRSIITTEVVKWNIVTGGVVSGKINPIFPRVKKALWWPGIRGDRPVAAVYKHPGIKAQDLLGRANNRYNQEGGDLRIVDEVGRETVLQATGRRIAGGLLGGLRRLRGIFGGR